jgi:hypothetical protein
MRIHQVREVVSWAVDFHEKLAKRYAALAKASQDERVRMALAYLADHDRAMLRGLARYLAADNEHRKVLDTWYTDFAELPHPEVLDCLCGCMQFERVDDVLATALTIHRMLEDMYRQRACAAAIADEEALFTALAAGHNAEVRRIVRDMARLGAY